MNFAVKSALALFLALIMMGNAVEAKPGRGGSYARPDLSEVDRDDDKDDFDSDLPEQITFDFDPAKSKPLTLKKVVLGVRHGQRVGTFGHGRGFFCATTRHLTLKNSRGHLDPADYASIFFQEALAQGLRTVGDPNAIFGDPSIDTAEIIVGATLTDINVNQCQYGEYGMLFARIESKARVIVDWQIYSTLDRRVVYQVSTTGTYDQKDPITADPDFYGAILGAFTSSARRLLADKGFQQVISQSGKTVSPSAAPIARETLHLTRGDAKIATKVTDYSKTVGTIFNLSGGQGSGFFITSQGHMLTNEHVVGSAQFVKVHMGNGDEYLAEVIRRDKARDVALLKVSAKPQWIVQLNRIEPEVGEDVYAVGSPLDPTLSATMTRGIVSAKRVIDGQRYIQADASILPGNSGGPLFNSEGSVIAISTAYRADSNSTINFFGPVNDLLNTLAIDVQ